MVYNILNKVFALIFKLHNKAKKVEGYSMATRRSNGQGSIAKRADGKYVVRLQCGKKENGKPYVKTRVATTKKEAEQKLKELEKEFKAEARRMTVDFTDLTVPEYFDKFLKYKSRTLKDKSLNRLESTINTHITPYFDMTLFCNLTSDKIQERLDEMYDNGLSHSSIKKVRDAFNAVFNWAIDKQQDLSAEDNPMKRVEMIASHKFEKKKIRSFDAEEKEAFVTEALRKFRNGTYVHKLGPAFVLMLNTGIREGELCALDRNNHITDETIIINDNATTIRNKKHTGDSIAEKKWVTVINSYDTKTPEGQREIPLNNTAKRMIEEIKKLYPEREDHGLLIYAGDGGIFPPANTVKAFKNICAAAGIENIKGHGPHVLRHTFATSLFEADFEVKVVSVLLGHKDVTVTQNTYIDVMKSQKTKAIKMIEIM